MMGTPLGAVIIAGGPGRRLATVTGDGAKALAPIAGHTLLDYQLGRVAALAPSHTVVIAHHHADAVRDAVGGRADVRVEEYPLGTAGGLHMLPTGPTRWLVINIDHVSDVDLVAFARDAKGPCTALLSTTAVHVDEGVVTVKDGQLVDWRERPTLHLPVTTGLYIFNAAALRAQLHGQAIHMPALVQALMPEGVHAVAHPGTWIDAGTPARLARADAFLRDS